MTIIYRSVKDGDAERVLRNVTRIVNQGGEYRIQQKNKDSQLVISMNSLVEILD